mmetsp:Transcript_5071/g.20262  ORF Transcript_5071/g.20262 Transcript_5071/m.20262 type:complete len:370 (-) Transcript_5071:2450-3559(-)
MPSTRGGASSTSVPVDAAKGMKLKTQTRSRGNRKRHHETIDFDSVSGLNVVSPAVAPSPKRVWRERTTSEKENQRSAEKQPKRRRAPKTAATTTTTTSTTTTTTANEAENAGVPETAPKKRGRPRSRRQTDAEAEAEVEAEVEEESQSPAYPASDVTADDMALPQGSQIQMLLSAVETAVSLESKVIATTLANTHEDLGSSLLRILTAFQEAVARELEGQTDEEETVQEEIRRLSRQESVLEETLKKCTDEAVQWEALRQGLTTSQAPLGDGNGREDATQLEIESGKDGAQAVSATEAIETAYSKAGGAFAAASNEARSLLGKLKKLEAEGGPIPSSESLQRQLFSVFMQWQRKNGSADVREDIRGILK